MKKAYLMLAMTFVLIALSYSVAFINYPIYQETGTINYGLNGGINAFFAGVIANVLELIFLVIGLWMLSRKATKEAKNPTGFTPVNDSQYQIDYQ